MSIVNLNQPSPEHKLFAIYHNHEYGSTQFLLWSKVFPTEEQAVESIGINFEPEKGEFIDLDEIRVVHTLELT